MLNPNLNYVNLFDQEYQLYSKNLILNQISLHGQKRLKQAKVLLIGVGGLGCPAIIYLISNGIGKIGLIDADVINLSNLNRQILYNINDINTSKTTISKHKLAKINPYCQINTYNISLNQQNATQIIQHYDLVIDCTDNFQTRYIIDTVCFNLHKVHIYGAVDRFEGQMSVFNYKNNLRYSDIYTHHTTQIMTYNNCNNTGVLNSITGIIGILQSTEALKIILGLSDVMTGKLLVYNALKCQLKIIPLYKKKININNNYKYSYNQNISLNNIPLYKDKIVIIDIREIQEFEVKHLQYSINIPLQLFSHVSTIMFFKKKLKNKIILLYCTSKNRSFIAYNILKKHKITSIILN